MLSPIDLEDETIKNNNYRKVLQTTTHQQLVLMCLKPGEDIPQEIHEDHDQFIRVEKGECMVKLGKEMERKYKLTDGYSIIIPANTWHYVTNAGSTDVKLYTIYSPREHEPDRVDKRQPKESEMHGGNKRYKLRKN